MDELRHSYLRYCATESLTRHKSGALAFGFSIRKKFKNGPSHSLLKQVPANNFYEGAEESGGERFQTSQVIDVSNFASTGCVAVLLGISLSSLVFS